MKIAKLALFCLIPSVLISTSVEAGSCQTNNVYRPYTTPFACEQQETTLTAPAAQSIDFEYNSYNTQCTIISNTAQTIYLNSFQNCTADNAEPTRQKISLMPGENQVQLDSSCYKNKDYNQASFYIAQQDKTSDDKLMISCSTTTNNKATNTMDGISSNNFTSLGA